MVMREAVGVCIRGAALLAAAVATLAAQPVPESGRQDGYWTQEWRGEVQAAERVRVRSRGRVVVRGADHPNIRFRLATRARGAQDGSGVPEIFRRSGITTERRTDGTAVLLLREPECSTCRVTFLLEVHLPRDTSEVDIVTSRGDVEVSGVGGSVGVRTDGGSIAVNAIGGALTAVTAGGSIRLGTVGGPVVCETAGGSIELQRSRSARLKTAIGSIRVVSVSGDLEAVTGGGAIEIGNVEGPVRATTGGGRIRVSEAGSGLQATAGAGDIWIGSAAGTLRLASGAGDIVLGLREGTSLLDSLLETGSGSIRVSLPESLALTLEASIGLARVRRAIRSEFPTIKVMRAERRAGTVSQQAAGLINGGGSLMRIRSGTGRIEIRRQRPVRGR